MAQVDVTIKIKTLALTSGTKKQNKTNNNKNQAADWLYV